MVDLFIFQVQRFAIMCSAGGNFFSFPTWYKYVCGGSSGEKDFVFLPNATSGAPSDIPLVLLAVVEILLRIAGMAAVAYVVFGAIKYVTSQGDPAKIGEAKGTIINALVGMVIAMFAIAVVAFIGNRVG